MAPKSGSSTATMKQRTLSFASSKRGAAATAPAKANTLKQSLSISAVKPPASERKEVASRTVSTDSTATAYTISSTSIPSDDDIVVLSTESTTAQREPKRLKTTSGAAKPLARNSKRTVLTHDSSSEDEEDLVAFEGNLQVIEKSDKLSKLFTHAREKNGYLPLGMMIEVVMPPQSYVYLVHADEQTKTHHILRVFDKYGAYCLA